MALQDCSLVYSLYDTMCYDYEHGASDICKDTDVFLARQISDTATLSKISCLIDVKNMDTSPGIRIEVNIDCDLSQMYSSLVSHY